MRPDPGVSTRQRVGLILGPLLFALACFLPALTGLDDAPHAVLAVTLWVDTWWITEGQKRSLLLLHRDCR